MSLLDASPSKEPDPFMDETLGHMDALYGVACRLTRAGRIEILGD